MTIEEITAELSKLDAGALAAVSNSISTISIGKLYHAELQTMHAAGMSYEAIETELNKIIDENHQSAKPDNFAENVALWKLAILKQMKEAERHDNA